MTTNTLSGKNVVIIGGTAGIGLATAQAAAAASGFPPNVEPWEPGVRDSAIDAVVQRAPKGSPLANALARVIMSGSTPLS